jgi:RsiW-degrading membrane proteinase PrsW (M82 family)
MIATPNLRRDPEAIRRSIGITFLVAGMVTGAFFLLVIFFLPHLVLSKHAGVEAKAMFVGAMFAVPLLLVYVWVPWIVDRYDPEPVWALALCLAWGAIGAGGWSLCVNSVVDYVATGGTGKGLGSLVTTVICAPVVEELTKGFAVFFMFYFMRRHFDGVVDGAIYGVFAALGFACFENILYYSNAVRDEMLKGEHGLLAGQVLMRGFLKPWGHPLYTAITGLGFGIARETNRRWVKWVAVLGCWSVAVFLHALWNASAVVAGKALLPFFFFVMLSCFALVLFLVKRKGKIIRDHLRDEVLIGNLTPWELDLVTSPVARIRATFSFGGEAGRRFVDTSTRLALSKWHVGRTAGRCRTLSSETIAPLRRDLHHLRSAVSVALRRPLPQPRPWYPPFRDETRRAKFHRA